MILDEILVCLYGLLKSIDGCILDYFFQRYSYSKRTWKLEILSSFGMEGRWFSNQDYKDSIFLQSKGWTDSYPLINNYPLITLGFLLTRIPHLWHKPPCVQHTVGLLLHLPLWQLGDKRKQKQTLSSDHLPCSSLDSGVTSLLLTSLKLWQAKLFDCKIFF